MSDELKPCPFCGHKPQGLCDFTLRPARNGTASVAYTSWRLLCNVDDGGCGASVTSDSRKAVLSAWNRRAAIQQAAVAVPEGFQLVPIEPNIGILRAFYECPPDELLLAWQAMLIVAKKQLAASPSTLAREAGSSDRMPEPEVFMYQHEETGQIGYVDAQQIEWGFEEKNPRLKIVSPMYTAAQVQAMLAQGLARLPPEKSMPDPDWKGDVDQATYKAGWNDCRTAMLEAAQRPPATPVCQMCSGHGLIGGMTIEGGEGYPCPDCNSPDPARALLQEAMKYWPGGEMGMWMPYDWIERVRAELKGGAS